MIYRLDQFSKLLPKWLGYYIEKQKFMRFDRLEKIYVLDQHIKPRAHYDHPEDMPPDMYTEAFDGHHGSKFVAIDPKDKRTIQLWNIPRHCWNIFRFPHLPYFHLLSLEPSDDDQLMMYTFASTAKLRFLACVRGSSQTPRVDTESPNSGFAFT
ncbi:hypothetical protein SLS63_003729 [Diaporthe eres]|uniref:Uncharacterized protein n=1 Tax=Diaporthe eres TaxID=83184 RepID=A0ABR1PFS9_DIAER